jgi:hypothetical protein
MTDRFSGWITAGLAALFLFAAGAALATSPALAADPCEGISDVSDVDGPAISEFDGSLDSVKIGTFFTRPVLVTSPPGDTHRIFIVEQDGTIRIVKDGVLLATPFLDISAITRSPSDGGGDEQGLLGLAFDPNYDTTRRFFIYHTNNAGGMNHVARYLADATNPDITDTATRTVLISFSHPTFPNHNGGMIAFRPSDGYLYIGTGDGGNSCDPGSGIGNAQTLTSNLGKLLRLDVSGSTYTSPSTNPFFGAIPGNDEIWSYGLRNPWRYSFDRANSNLYIGDVGQGQWEEVDCRLASAAGGDNYGWVEYEGTHCNPNPSCPLETSDCSVASYVGPLLEYCHPGVTPCTTYVGSSVTGGYVYRGCRMGDLAGTYFYGDYISSWVRTIRTDNACSGPNPSQINNRTNDLNPGAGGTANSITSFGEDARGELYIARRGTVAAQGEVYKIVPALRIMTVSATRAPQFLVAANGAMSWEDVAASSSQPIALYRVYRSTTGPAGTFSCLQDGASPSWTGDPATPPSGTAWFYLVTARNAAGDETRPGSRSDGTPRTVDTLSVCTF